MALNPIVFTEKVAGEAVRAAYRDLAGADLPAGKAGNPRQCLFSAIFV